MQYFGEKNVVSILANSKMGNFCVLENMDKEAEEYYRRSLTLSTGLLGPKYTLQTLQKRA